MIHRSFCGRWDSPWGHGEDEPVPDKTSLFPRDEPGHGPSTSGMEDFLQHNGVFLNALRGTPCHQDSYMTMVSYGRLEACLALLKETFAPTLEEWKVLTDEWLGNPNMQPPLRIVARLVCGFNAIEPANRNE